MLTAKFTDVSLFQAIVLAESAGLNATRGHASQREHAVVFARAQVKNIRNLELAAYVPSQMKATCMPLSDWRSTGEWLTGEWLAELVAGGSRDERSPQWVGDREAGGSHEKEEIWS
ncbi:hypothetical protein PAPYR_8762 [Paratrimastix pyriformis]|uniref:Uncharacterized protein n=1 Tax=Paratrimastix pyriformis TaxID=342808 RepID=A0ABQ8UFF3_9EUKA|nr:hypothetical protein PAPYR_8762 [Paratrimastix pyriformis]